MVDSSKQSSSNGNDGLFLAAPLLESLFLSIDFRVLFAAAGSKRNLDQQRLEISTGFANASGFLFAGTLRILRGKASSGAKVFGGIKHRHVSADFSEDTDCSKSIVDTRNSQEQFNLRKIILCDFKDERLQFLFVLFQGTYVAADDFEFLYLFVGKDAVNRFLNLGNGRFAMSMHKGSHVKRLSRMLQQLRCDGGCALAEHITEHVIKLEAGNSETILGAIFSPAM